MTIVPVATENRFPRWLRWILWGFIVAGCSLQAYEIPNRGIDPDELEHLHAAYCVSRGDIPYRDFFEHHGPALYYFVLPLMKICGPQLSVLWLARLTMWGCGLATLGLTGRLAGRWAGEGAGLLAMCLLAWTTIFHLKSIEFRPDVPAMLLLMLAVSQFGYQSVEKRDKHLATMRFFRAQWAAGKSQSPLSADSFTTKRGSWRRFLYVGLLAGLAMLFTQKSIVPAAGIAAAACLARLATRSAATESVGTVLMRVAVPLAAGIAVVWGIAGLLFASTGAATEFWRSTWLQLWIWPVRSSRWDYLRPTLAGDFTVWVAAGVEIVALLLRARDRETWHDQRGAVAVIAAVCIGSLVIVKATYPQFYLLWIPFLAALAARRIVAVRERFIQGRAGRLPVDKGDGRFASPNSAGVSTNAPQSQTSFSRGVYSVIIAGTCLVLAQSALWRRAFWADAGAGALPRLSEIDDANVLVLLALAIALAGVVVAAYRRQGEAILLLAGLGMGYGMLRNVDIALWSNADQVAAINAVNRHVSPNGRVLDGFTGYGALRPHAWYYWWINEYSLALVPEEEREVQLLKLLEESPPTAVLFDSNVARLPPRVRDWICAHYRPGKPAVLWLPR